MAVDYYKQLLEPLYQGRKWILIADRATEVTTFAQRILDAGATNVMVVAGTEGTGPQPTGVEMFIVGTTGTTLMDGIRASVAAITDPSPEMCAAVTSFDPTNQATVLTSYLIPISDLCGRPVYGGPKAEWKALEDKILIEGLWRRAGVATAPSLIVDSDDDAAVRKAAAQLMTPYGAVLVADNTEGWHGGAEYTRYLVPGGDWSETLAFFAQHARQVRVMPFLQGVPCSIHGLVTEHQVLAFRPVEMLVYRRLRSDEFVYTGINTLWDPPVNVREEMRQAVRDVGALIREEVGYRGAFGIDGVCTVDGFRPTELNPRLSGGLTLQTETAGGYPIGDINRAIVDGLDQDLRLGDLEREIVDGANATRSGRWIRPITHLSVSETTEQPILYNGSSWAPTASDDATAMMMLGPSPQGALVLVRLTEHHGLTSGASIAEIAASSFAVSDELWDTRVGPLVTGTSAQI